MAGRAGRPRYDPYGEVIILCSNERRIEDLAAQFIDGEPEHIVSRLDDVNQLRNHILGLIVS